MSDLALRRLERAAQAGDPEAAEALQRKRCRLGTHGETEADYHRFFVLGFDYLGCEHCGEEWSIHGCTQRVEKLNWPMIWDYWGYWDRVITDELINGSADGLSNGSTITFASTPRGSNSPWTGETHADDSVAELPWHQVQPKKATRQQHAERSRQAFARAGRRR